MDFVVDPIIQQFICSDTEKNRIYGLAICALFHQPKPLNLIDFYHRLISRFHAAFDTDEQRAIYICPMEYLHITIALLINFKKPRPPSLDDCRTYWQRCFATVKVEHSCKSIVLSMSAIRLSSAAAYFEFNDEHGEMTRLRKSIQRLCVPDEKIGCTPIFIPNIIHITFLRFKDTVPDPTKFERTFHSAVQDMMTETNLSSIRFTIDEICLALETGPYLHNPFDTEHILDTMKLNC